MLVNLLAVLENQVRTMTKKNNQELDEGIFSGLNDIYDAYKSGNVVDDDIKKRQEIDAKAAEYAKQTFFSTFAQALTAGIQSGRVNTSAQASPVDAGSAAFSNMTGQLIGNNQSSTQTDSTSGVRAFDSMASQLSGSRTPGNTSPTTGTDYATKRVAAAAAARADMKTNTSVPLTTYGDTRAPDSPTTPTVPTTPTAPTTPSTAVSDRDPLGRREPTLSPGTAVSDRDPLGRREPTLSPGTAPYKPTAAAQRLSARRRAGSRRLREMFEGRSLESGEILADRSDVYHATKLLRESDLAWADVGLTLVEEGENFRIVSLESAGLWKKYNLFEAAGATQMSIAQWVPRFVASYLARYRESKLNSADARLLNTLAVEFQNNYADELKRHQTLVKIWNLILNHLHTAVKSKQNGKKGARKSWKKTLDRAVKSMPVDGSDRYTTAVKTLPTLMATITRENPEAMRAIIKAYKEMLKRG
jgi:hypothetical protein